MGQFHARLFKKHLKYKQKHVSGMAFEFEHEFSMNTNKLNQYNYTLKVLKNTYMEG